MTISPYKIIKADKLLLICLIFPAIFLFELIGTTYFNMYGDNIPQFELSILGSHSIFFYMFAVSACVFIPLFVMRLRSTREHLENGTELQGKVVSVRRMGNDCTIGFSYDYNGQSFKSKYSTQFTKQVKNLQTGQDIALIVSNINNKKAFIKNLFV